MRVLLLCLLLASSLVAAPAPFRRAEPPRAAPHVEPGRYRMSWAGSDWDVTLGCGGAYEGTLAGSTWRWSGTWRYDRTTRVFVVEESSAGDAIRWEAQLDRALAGKTSCDGVSMSLSRR